MRAHKVISRAIRMEAEIEHQRRAGAAYPKYAQRHRHMPMSRDNRSDIAAACRAILFARPRHRVAALLVFNAVGGAWACRRRAGHGISSVGISVQNTFPETISEALSIINLSAS